MEESELGYWLALWRVKGVGPKIFSTILRYFSSLSIFFNVVKKKQALPFPLDAEILAQCQNPDWRGVEKDLAWCHKQGNHQIITSIDSDYPPLLKEIHLPPPLLFIRGNKRILHRNQIAIVGSRKPTLVGEETARQFASALVKQGWCVTSGLALGVDGAAHRGALQAGGETIAVLGCGIDQIYPYAHRDLMDACVEHGAVMSVFPCGVMAQASHFPRRNRFVSGLARGVLVVEAALRSGSLITARLALEQGREVFAIPGSIYSEQSQGCLHLIQQGAKCVGSVEDIVDELVFCPKMVDQIQPYLQKSLKALPDEMPMSNSEVSQKTAQKIAQNEHGCLPQQALYAQGNEILSDNIDQSLVDRRILAMLSASPISLDTMIDHIGADAPEVLASVQSLLLSGKALLEPQGYILRPP